VARISPPLISSPPTSHRQAPEGEALMKIEESVLIHRPAEDVFAFLKGAIKRCRVDGIGP